MHRISPALSVISSLFESITYYIVPPLLSLSLSLIYSDFDKEGDVPIILLLTNFLHPTNLEQPALQHLYRAVLIQNLVS